VTRSVQVKYTSFVTAKIEYRIGLSKTLTFAKLTTYKTDYHETPPIRPFSR
jgi:hypothetical protein